MGRRFETRHRLLQPAANTPRPLRLDGNDVVVVTGGARGITAECALALAERTGAKFALVGSSPHPSSTNGAANGSSPNEISETLKRFAQQPGQCEYFPCDITDAMAVRQLIAEIESKLGKVTGLVHGAGRNHPKMASAASDEQALAEVSPKVLGATNLLEATFGSPASLSCWLDIDHRRDWNSGQLVVRIFQRDARLVAAAVPSRSSRYAGAISLVQRLEGGGNGCPGAG